VIVVTKIGTSSITDPDGEIDESAIGKFCADAAALRAEGHRIVLVVQHAGEHVLIEHQTGAADTGRTQGGP
jgi:glutamate 5-kinase